MHQANQYPASCSARVGSGRRFPDSGTGSLPSGTGWISSGNGFLASGLAFVSSGNRKLSSPTGLSFNPASAGRRGDEMRATVHEPAGAEKAPAPWEGKPPCLLHS